MISTFNSYPNSCHNLYISDHLAVTMNIEIPTLTPIQSWTITFGNLNSLSHAAVSASLTYCLAASSPPPSDDPADVANYHNSTLSCFLDQLAPTKSKAVSFTHSAPWYTPHTPPNEIPSTTMQRCTPCSPDYLLFSPHPLWLQQPKALFSTINSLLKPHDNIPSSFTTEKCQSFFHTSKQK